MNLLNTQYPPVVVAQKKTQWAITSNPYPVFKKLLLYIDTCSYLSTHSTSHMTKYPFSHSDVITRTRFLVP